MVAGLGLPMWADRSGRRIVDGVGGFAIGSRDRIVDVAIELIARISRIAFYSALPPIRINA